MADVKVSALTSAGALSPSDVFYVVQGTSSFKVALSAIDAYVDPVQTVATSAQNFSGNADAYLTATRVVLPQTRTQVGTVYRAKLVLTKTAAGTATPTFNVRVGTAGTTADTARLTYTGVAQTAAVDTAYIEVQATFRAVGASAVLAAWLRFDHDLASTGFANATRGFQGQAVSAAFDSTTASTGIGISINPGASASWTLQQSYVELLNLA